MPTLEASQRDFQSARQQSRTVLLVDDDPLLLEVLIDELALSPFDVVFASGGGEALQLLQARPIDIVVADYVMPGMDGIQLLAKIRELRPQTVRVLLTGFGNLDVARDAISRGEVFRILAKPWSHEELLETLEAAAHRASSDQNRERETLALKEKSDLLLTRSSVLEAAISEHIQTLAVARDEARGYSERMRNILAGLIRSLFGLSELRDARLARHSKNVADLSRSIAAYLKLENRQVRDIALAGLLHDVGHIGMPDEVLYSPHERLSDPAGARLRRHPGMSEAALSVVEELAAVCTLVRSHHERYDGTGYPERLMGEEIPLGAQILAVADHFDELTEGILLPRRLSEEMAIRKIWETRGRGHAERVVDALLAVLHNSPSSSRRTEVLLSVRELRPGMVLASDVTNEAGVIILKKGFLFDHKAIARLAEFETGTKSGALLIAVACSDIETH